MNTNTMTERRARAAIKHAEMDTWPDNCDISLSEELDQAWDWAEDTGRKRLAKALQVAFNTLTGRDPLAAGAA